MAQLDTVGTYHYVTKEERRVLAQALAFQVAWAVRGRRDGRIPKGRHVQVCLGTYFAGGAAAFNSEVKAAGDLLALMT